MAETLIPHIYQVVVKLCVAFQFTTIGHYSDTLVPQKNLLCHTPWHKMFQFFCKGYAFAYGAPFVTCTLLLTEANFVKQKSLLSDKSNLVYDKILLLSDKS